MGLWTLFLAAGALLFVFFILYLASRYKRCPSDKILVVYGKVGAGQSARCIHGGGALIVPLFQDHAYLSLTPMTINIDLQNALSMQNIRVNVPSTFTVGISTDPSIMTNAAERLLGLTFNHIEAMAREIIFGQLRLTVASLTIEQINQDRESFLAAIIKNVEPELSKIGLNLINVNITDITDESNYIASIGKKAAAEAINRAKVDVAEQEKQGAVGESDAVRERTIRVAENIAAADKGQKKAESERRVFVHQQEALAVRGENEAKANIASYNAQLSVKEAESLKLGEVARREASAEIQKAQAKAELERLNAEHVVRKEIERRQIEIAAEAQASKLTKEAQGQANAILAKYEAEAKGMLQVLEAKAQGYQSLVGACGGDARAASTLLMVEKIEEIARIQVEAISNLKIDKITIWDSGGGQGSSATSNFAASLIKSLPPLHEVAALAGIELPEYLGTMNPQKPSAPPAAPHRASTPPPLPTEIR
ncbi:MAG: SPFH domain-containing protein [Myxococcota bacterium]|nr:SPFH domain-containing protein [Myxococcota bacterium]